MFTVISNLIVFAVCFLLFELHAEESAEGGDNLVLCRNDAPKFRVRLILQRNCLHISLLMSSEFKRINQFLFPLKLSENDKFTDDFIGNRSFLIRLNSLNIRCVIWRRSLTTVCSCFYFKKPFALRDNFAIMKNQSNLSQK